MVGKPMAAAVRPRNWRREEVRGWRFMVLMRWKWVGWGGVGLGLDGVGPNGAFCREDVLASKVSASVAQGVMVTDGPW
jgi:hypothetical protein